MKIYRSEVVGFLCGFGVVLPLFGPIGSVPSSFIAMPVAALAFTLFLWWRMWGTRPSWTARAVIGLGLLFTWFVVSAAQADQAAFLSNFALWRNHSVHYVESKLLMYFVSFAAPFVFATILSEAAHRQRTSTGAMAGATVVAAVAAIRVLVSDGDVLIRAPYMVARDFLVLNEAYSTVSYGLLFALGAVAALRFRYGWAFAGVLLFVAALLSRRTETLLIISAIIGFYGIQFVQTRMTRHVLARMTAALAIGGLLFLIGHNDHNLQYFSRISAGVEQRVALAETIMAEPVAQGAPNNDSAGSTTKRTLLASADLVPAADAASAPRLGGYAEIGEQKYPHNLILEAYYELGWPAAVTVLLVLLIPLSSAAVVTWARALSVNAAIMAGLAGVSFAVSMKAGDITMFGRFFFFAVAASAVLTSNLRTERGAATLFATPERQPS